MTNKRSRALYDRALSVLPGGVNSSVRATTPYPIFISRGDGGHVIDADGNRYIDYIMGYGPLLFGHTLPDPVNAAIQSTVTDGPMYGAPTEIEVDLAEFVVRHVPSVEMLRFVNSGTEATVSAVRLARGYTNRNKIVIMDGGYHGAQESTLVTGPTENPSPSTSGIPPEFAKHTLPVPFNDIDTIQRVFEAHGNEIAAVLTEPILGNTGIIAPTDEFHDTIRELCNEYGSLFILDEVITGFRIGGLSCAQGALDITPDITTFGKVIGGGFPVGAIGGPAHVLQSFTPSGEIFQSGTFSGHPVTMAAGLETLKHAAENDTYSHLQQLGEQLRTSLQEILTDRAPRYTVVGRDSMFKVIFTRKPGVQNATDVRAAQKDRWERLFRPAMKDRGVLLPANQLESQFVCGSHTQTDIEETIEAYKHAL